MSQTFLLERFQDYRDRGLRNFRAGRLDDARHELLKASEYLYKLAAETEGRLQEQRVRNAEKLKQMALNIDPKAPPKSKKPGAQGGGGGSGAQAASEDGEGSKFRVAEKSSVRFADVAGLEDVKEEIRLKLIYPFAHREQAAKFKIKPGGGLLLYGPPGTGKTLIARAVAGEIDAAFYTVKPSEIMSKWVGDSEQNIAELFREARKNPVSMIFIDEIEALVPKRRSSRSTVMQRVVPQILAELEGFDTAGQNPLLFLGATNEPWSLDSAVLRPGRFDTKVYVGLPDVPARRKMLDLYLANRPLALDVDLDALAVDLRGYSGADIRNVGDRAASEAFLETVETGEDTVISAALLKQVLSEVRPSVSQKDIERFDKYAQGM